MVLPADTTSLVAGLDSYARLRNLGLLAEFCIGNGKLVVSSMGLHQHQQYPEVAALIHSILQYMSGDDFAPIQHVSFKQLNQFAPIF